MYHIIAYRTTTEWSKLVDEVLEDERRKADEHVRIREEGNRNSKEA